MNNKYLKLYFIWLIFIIAALGVTVYLLIDVGSAKEIMVAYDDLKPENTSSYSKQLQFVESYTRNSGDTSLAIKMGLSAEDINSILSGGSTQAGSEYGDAIECAKHVATTFVNTWKMQGSIGEIYSVSDNPSRGPGTIKFGGNEAKYIKHRDCSCLVNAISMLMNWVKDYEHRNTTTYYNWSGSNTSGMPSTYKLVYELDMANKRNTEHVAGKTMQDCDIGVGSIFVYKTVGGEGHCAIVVKKEGEKLYFADGGGDEHITRTAQDGYSYTFNLSDDICAWRNSYVSGSKGVERVKVYNLSK